MAGHIIGTPLRKTNLKDSYDTIIVGSGVGGLSTAACLAKQGKDVLVLEKHYTAGGFSHVFRRKGYEWDVGLHYVGGVHNKNFSAGKIFDYITDGDLEWNKIQDIYDRIIIGDKEFNFPTGRERLQNELKNNFPNNQSDIDNYFSLVHKVNKSSSTYFLEKMLPYPKATKPLFSKLLRKGFLSFASKTTDEVMREITDNELLRGVLTGQWGDYGLTPDRSSFAIHAMTARHFFDGASYPVGGSSAIANTITNTIENNGGSVVTSAGVEEILVEKNKVIGVRLSNGQEIFSDAVVSNAGMGVTYSHLFSEENKKKYSLESKLNKLIPSNPHLCLYVGVKEDSKDLGLEQTNLWIYADSNHNETLRNFELDQSNDFPIVYISFPSTKDPEWNKQFKGRSTIEMISPVPYSSFSDWDGTKWRRRGDDYNQIKEDFSQRFLDVLYKHCPQLEGKIDHYELSTPLSTKEFCNYEFGEAYGMDHTPARFMSTDIDTRGPIKGLYMTGQDITAAGFVGAASSGVMTSLSILGFYKGRELLKLL